MADKPIGYEFDVVGNELKECQCIICLMLIKEAVELPCTHCMCKQCLLHYEQYSNGKFLCPMCQKEYKLEEKRENGALDRIVLTSLEVECLQVKKGCDWQGCVSNYEDHEKRCVYATTGCINQNCLFTCELKDKKNHLKECQYRNVYCQYCYVELQSFKMQDHFTTCQSYPATCKNMGCKEVVRRNMMEMHCNEECRYQILTCMYRNVGCHEIFHRMDQEAHIKDNVDHHMLLMLQNQSLLMTRNQELEGNLENSMSQLKQNQKRIEVLEYTLQEKEEKLKNQVTRIEELEKAMYKTDKKVERIEHETDTNKFRIVGLEIFAFHISKLQELNAKHWENSKKPHFNFLFEDGYHSNSDMLEWQKFQTDFGETCKDTDYSLVLGKSIKECISVVYPDKYEKRYQQLMHYMEPHVRYRSGPYRYFKIYSCRPECICVRWFQSRDEYEKELRRSKLWVRHSLTVALLHTENYLDICLWTRLDYNNCYLLHNKSEKDSIKLENKGVKNNLANPRDYMDMDFILIKF